MLGKGLWDDQGYAIATISPRTGGINLGRPEQPFDTLYIDTIVTTGSEQLSTIIIPSTGGGFFAYNTVDQTTDVEDFKMDWNTNVYQLGTRQAGTGTLRKVEIGAFGASTKSTLIFDNATAAGPYLTFGDGSATSLASAAASGTTVFAKINPYVNQSGTAAYTGLLINAVENATGSGAHTLLDLQLGGTSKFHVLSSGATTIVAGGLTVTLGGAVITAGGLLVGSGSLNASAALEVISTTQGLLLPRMTTAQRDAIGTPAAGLVVYNTTTNKINVRVAAAWEAVTSA